MEKYDEKLKRILVASGWSQDALADRIGVSFPTLNSWVNGKSEPREAFREKIELVAAEVLGVDAIDSKQLSELKTRAVRKRFSVKRLLNNRGVLDDLTVGITYHSNATEGSTMTISDVSAVILESKTLRNRTNIEQREAVNHQAALHYVLDKMASQKAEFRFTPELILGIHLRLMNGIVADAGSWRKHNVRIRGAYVPLANFIKIEGLIENWCNAANGETTDKIGLLAATHAEFEKIHPFSDGNGRTGRILMFALALKLEIVPPILPRDRKMAYYKYLEMAQMRDLNDPLEMFIAENIIKTAEVVEK